MIPAKAFKNIKSNIICYTYNKSYKKEKWPEYFLRIPNKGDYISSENGKCLKVGRIIHDIENNEPYILVELR